MVTIPEANPTPNIPKSVAPAAKTTKGEAKILARLTDDISDLWMKNERLTWEHKFAAIRIRQVRRRLAEQLFEMKTILSKPDAGRGDLWKQVLREMLIPRWVANSLINRHVVTMCGDNQVIPTEEASDPEREFAEKMAKLVWSDAMPFLTSDKSVVQLITHILTEADVIYEERAEGLFIPNPVSDDAAEWENSHPAIRAVAQPGEEGSTVAETPREVTSPGADTTDGGVQ